ncbi:hypothetical protein TRM7557_01089 [Tritonibacter multivorans]|uniref:Copper chaperone PCu(A)C n=1 Tax=Tritonibacter multivorans TaxID=928856 RepID=A0A0N7LZ70_9RHOB|nr:copper chaperone PCu(A)C [Tritonibacter multivorans]MDA7421805.1 copper chaperone PCu(A)C [Tritonibacter multivorans]CUH76841.1 hypothetical protein TRM7557_01089 [Tritonibacter multivorans]SFD06054.1 hypothetical protein SAMN04488049_106118 [Tritonibacter multivorans]
MSFKSLCAATAATLALTTAAFADSQIMVHDAYARSANPKAGAAFMHIMNHGDEADRLVAVKSDVSARTELHTHKEDANGVMKMMEVKEGFEIPAGGMHMLKRGGDHVMFMGLNAPFEDGATVPVTLVFEKAGEVVIDVAVDQKRKPKHGGAHGGHDHSGHDHSNHGDH